MLKLKQLRQLSSVTCKQAGVLDEPNLMGHKSSDVEVATPAKMLKTLVLTLSVMLS